MYNILSKKARARRKIVEELDKKQLELERLELDTKLKMKNLYAGDIESVERIVTREQRAGIS